MSKIYRQHQVFNIQLPYSIESLHKFFLPKATLGLFKRLCTGFAIYTQPRKKAQICVCVPYLCLRTELWNFSTYMCIQFFTKLYNFHKMLQFPIECTICAYNLDFSPQALLVMLETNMRCAENTFFFYNVFKPLQNAQMIHYKIGIIHFYPTDKTSHAITGKK